MATIPNSVTKTPVDTSKVTGLRVLEFHSYDEIVQEAEKLVRASRVLQRGNWDLGQVLHHLATGMTVSIDGPPLYAPLFYRIVARMLKKRILAKPFTGGVKLPKSAQSKLIASPGVSAEAGLNALKNAAHRLQTETQRVPHGFFGRLTNQEWDTLHFRHCALHLSFIEPQE